MQSDPGSPQTTQSISPVQSPLPQSPNPQATVAGLIPSSNPMEFIKQNIEKLRAERGEVPKTTASPETPAAEPVKPVEEPAPKFFEEKTPEPAKELTPEEKSAKIAEEEIDKEHPDSNYAENYKKLKTKFKEVKQNYTQVQEAKTKAEKELEEYKTGAVVPEILKEKENEIARLSYYEKLHNLKDSKEYREAFVEPLNTQGAKLNAIATDYGVPEEIISKALQIDNRADLNRFLLENFDEVGALEVKGIINDMRQIQVKAREAEKEPEKLLTELQREQAVIHETRETNRKDTIATEARNSWVEAVVDIRKEGKVTELIRRENDPEFNKNFVDPILTQASTEYGKFITELAESGIPKLPPRLAKVVARSFLLSHASAVAIASRDAALSYASDLEKNNERVSRLIRPPVGGGFSAPKTEATPSIHRTPEEAAQALAVSVLSKTRK